MYIYLQARSDAPEGEELKRFINQVIRADQDAEIRERSSGPFLTFFIRSKALEGYFTTSIYPYLRLHKIGEQGGYFEIYVRDSINMTIYELQKEGEKIMPKDWRGDSISVFKQLAASNHAEREREPGLLRH